MDLPLGVMDPLFTAHLALELKMPVGELGERMSQWELCVFWPSYYNHKAEMAEAEGSSQ